MKFLIIRFSPVGAIVLTSPLLRCLRKAFPDAIIHFLADDACRSAVEFNPNIDKLHVLAHSRELMIEELRTEEYDHIIDLQNDSKSQAVWKALGKKPLVAGSKSFWSIFSSHEISHVAELQFKSLRSFEITNDGNGLEYFIAVHEETKKADIPGSHYAGYIVCAIGGNQSTGRWPVAKWKEFCSQLDHPIILLGGKDDTVAAKEIASVDDLKVYNACGKFSINEMADLIRKAKLVVSNEEDFMQIAAAYKRPVISLRVNKASPYPYYGNKFLTAQQQLLYDIFQSKRMENIGVPDVIAAVKKRL